MKNRNSCFVHFSFLILVSLIFSNFPLQASFSREEQELLRDVNRSNIKAILERYTTQNSEILDSSQDKDITVFIGKTGSGKSTLINYLNDKELRVNDTGNIILSNPSDPTTMKIGVSFESETLLPKFINSHNLLFYDLPGIGDTRGTAISLLNACFIKRIIESARTARLVFVIGQDEITAERGRLFRELSNITRNLLPNEAIEDFSSMVVTKSMPGRNNQQLINNLTQITEPGLLNPWIQAGRLTHMSAPFGDEVNQNDKVDILQIIQNTPARKVNNINISVIYSSQEQNNIRDVYANEIEYNFNTLLNNNININLIPSLDIGNLENKKQYFQNNFFNDLTLSLERSALIVVLRPISGDIYTSCWNESTGNIQIRIQNVLEQFERRKEQIRRIEADRLRIEEENRRIQAENARRAEEQRRLQAEAEQRRIQAENARILEEKRLNDPNNWPVSVEIRSENHTYWGQGFYGGWEPYRGGSGWSRRTKHRKQLYEREILVTVNKERKVATRPNNNQIVIINDWYDTSRTENLTGNVRATGQFIY